MQDLEGNFSPALKWLAHHKDPRLVSHGVVMTFADLLWNRVASYQFLLGRGASKQTTPKQMMQVDLLEILEMGPSCVITAIFLGRGSDWERIFFASCSSVLARLLLVHPFGLHH